MSATVLMPTSPEAILAASPIPQLRGLIVTTTDREVIIRGKVPTYYLKQLAQEAVRGAVGGRRLVNQVVVSG